VLRVEARVDSGAWTPLPPIDASAGLWGQALAGLAEGAHQVEVRAFDTWNNVGVAGPVAFTVAAAEPELTAVKSWELAADLDGDGVPSPGDRLGYTIVVSNLGDGAATEVALTDPIPADTAVVAGSVTTDLGVVTGEDPVTVAIGELAAGASATVLFEVAVDLPLPAAVEQVSNQGTVSSAELPALLTDDPAAGGAADPTVTPLTAAPVLAAEKTWLLAVDADGDGVPSPGDTVEYRVVLDNRGNTAATGVALVDPIPEHTAVVAGSVTASAGEVLGETPVEVAVGELVPGTPVTVAFRVAIDDPLPAGVAEIVNQGELSADGLDPVASDDPGPPGAADPTVTPVTAAPTLAAAKTDALALDAGGDGEASPGDELLYVVTVTNGGNTAALGVALTDPIPEHTAVVAGSVQASQGEVTGEDPVTVALGEIPAGETATVSFRVRIADPFPHTALGVANQGTVTADGLDPVVTDDPGTLEAGDPTATEVFVVPALSVSDTAAVETDAEAVFTVELSGPSNRPVTVDFATAAESAEEGVDYQAVAGTLTLPPGETAASVGVPLLDDPFDEADETFLLVLSAPSGAILVRAEGRATVLDDDLPAIAVGDVAVDEGAEEETVEAELAVSLSVATLLPIEIDWHTEDGTAVAGDDYEAASGTLSIPAGAGGGAVTVTVLGDARLEGDETFELVIDSVSYGVVADVTGTVTIVDDDPCPTPELLLNPGAESEWTGGDVPGWEEVEGDAWTRRTGSVEGDPDPAEGEAYFAAGEVEFAELAQDVDVAAFAPWIEEEDQRFAFEARVRTFAEEPPDVVRVVVEYRDVDDLVVLDAFDSGELASPEASACSPPASPGSRPTPTSTPSAWSRSGRRRCSSTAWRWRRARAPTPARRCRSGSPARWTTR
jgi:uncharacterized repeat protein (TIGR01451 family)